MAEEKNIYQDIEDAVLDKFQADTWFSNTSNVKTLETDLPDTLFKALDWTEIWAESMLPAAVVLTLVDAAETTQETMTELRYTVPIKVLGVVKATTKADARNAVQELVAQAERVFNGCRTTAGALNITSNGNFIRQVTGRMDIQQNEGARRWYGLAEVDATLVLVKSL